MAASGGGEAPCPPKRPTIIRPSNNTEALLPDVPARPAPPVPGNRPQPPLPSRPSEPSSKPPTLPPPPPRPANTARPQSVVSPTSKPSDGNNSVRKRPEITIVSARPMSEVGFRDSTVDNVVKKTENSEQSVGKIDVNLNGYAPPTAPPPNPRPVPRGAPPPVPRNSVTKPVISPDIEANKEENKDNSDTGSTVRIPDTKVRGPPPPVPRPTVIRPSAPPSSEPPRAPPPVPSRPKDQQQSLTPRHAAESNSEQSEKTLPPRPVGGPLPLPRSPSSKQKPPVPSSSISNESNSNEIQNEINQTIRSEVEVTNTDEKSDFYAVIEKPKRPTIIRPKKSDTDSNKDVITKTTPQLPPRHYDAEGGNETNTESKKKDLLSFDSPEEEHNAVPEFLRKKLKSTTQDNGNESDVTGSSAGSKPNMSPNTRPLSSGAPPPPTKPKPTVLPKPQVAAKPSISPKPVSSGIQTALPKMADEDSNDVTKPSDSVNSDLSEKHVVQKPTMVKRPTIIRPSKAALSGSVENVNQNIGLSETNLSVDDSAISSNMRCQPPLPNKRPVSMYDIHKAVEDEEKQLLAKSENDSITKSDENVNEQMVRPKPVPRPAVRSRPASMMVPPVSQPPPPVSNARALPGDSEISSQSPRPQIRSPNKPLQHDNDGDKSSRPHVPIGVAVLPSLSQIGPAKPMRRPPPPKSSPKREESSSSDDDEEFVIAQEKPDRPAAGPSPKSLSTRKESPTSMRRTSNEDDMKKPPRPGAPPPPRKSSINDSPEKDEGTDVKLRPPKPEARPQRPMSVPVKQNQPPKPQPPPQSHGRSSIQKNVPPLPRRPGPGHPLYHHMMQVPHGIALHDFTGKHADDISFKTGEVIILVQSVDADWMIGKISEKEGMFPRNFVKVKMPLPGEKFEDDVSSEDSADLFVDTGADKPDNVGKGPRCRARFDFDGEGPDDLVFEEGDVIKLVERVGLEWRKGEINGHTGLFPLSFVEVIEDLPQVDDIGSSTTVTALFDFDGEEGDLIFQAGETIKVTHVVNEEWLYGEIGNRKGQFPIQFIDNVPQGLPPLHNSEVKKDNSVVTRHEDVLSASLAMWDDTPNDTKFSSVGSSGNRPESTELPYCIAVYDYPGQTGEDLDFREGDRIEIVERISDDWLKGKLNGHVGMFPAAFVEVKVDVTKADVTMTTSKEVEDVYGVALYDFQGEADNELTFCAGDRFIVQGPVEGADDWRYGIINGRIGIFPAVFVKT